jgi:hypothetical protein
MASVRLALGLALFDPKIWSVSVIRALGRPVQVDITLSGATGAIE